MRFTLPTAILLAISALEAAALPKAATTMEKRYTTGWCGVHIVQYQKNDPANGNQPQYRLDITLKDAIGTDIGGLAEVTATPGVAVDVTSQLPEVFEVTIGAADDDSMEFHYGGQDWWSLPTQCHFGGYQGGNRKGDCGFTC